MKDIKLSFPYPATSRHNLSQDVALSLSMGLVTPVRVVEVLGGDSHRIGASFSLISNPLVKPLLQGVRMRLCRFWVPRRIYHLDQRANNSNYDLRTSEVRWGVMDQFRIPAGDDKIQYSNFQSSSLFDYLSLANIESNAVLVGTPADSNPLLSTETPPFLAFNAEPYLGYIDICRNFFADSASGCVAWSVPLDASGVYDKRATLISSLAVLDSYMDSIQNSEGKVTPYDYTSTVSVSDGYFEPIVFGHGLSEATSILPVRPNSPDFNLDLFGLSHCHLCVPLNRPDRLSRLFTTDPLTSQNATIAPSEITIGNLSFLTKLQRYLTRRFFGGSRFTDVMYSVLGQHVPHVDSPVLLDVFDHEIGSELVASTNATETQNPGVLGGFFSAAGKFMTSRGKFKRRYTFNEPGYIMDLVVILPRLFRSTFYPDFYPIVTDTYDSSGSGHMAQANFIPDFNGIGWQQPATLGSYTVYDASAAETLATTSPAICCEPSWQQYRTLPDVCHGLMNPNRGDGLSSVRRVSELSSVFNVNSPLFTFSDRMPGYNWVDGTGDGITDSLLREQYFRNLYTDFNDFNSVFGVYPLTYDNIFMVLSYSHQAKRQVTKRFTLSF